MVVLRIENLVHVVNQKFVLDELLEARNELILLVNDLGGHPAVPKI